MWKWRLHESCSLMIHANNWFFWTTVTRYAYYALCKLNCCLLYLYFTVEFQNANCPWRVLWPVNRSSDRVQFCGREKDLLVAQRLWITRWAPLWAGKWITRIWGMQHKRSNLHWVLANAIWKDTLPLTWLLENFVKNVWCLLSWRKLIP